MHSGETFRKLNNFADVPLVCDDGSVTIELALHFFIDPFLAVQDSSISDIVGLSVGAN